MANDETSQFLASIFKNSQAIELPGNGLGARLGVEVADALYFNVGIVEDDADFEDIGNSLFSFAQLTYSTSINELEGNYRLYGWFDTSAHNELKDTARTKENNYGMGISVDQAISETLAMFARFGWADPSVSNIELAWSTGLQLSGGLWNRGDDVLGIAIGQNIPGNQLEKSGTTNHKEGQLELYYNYRVFDYLTVSPLLQLIWNPNGVAEEAVGGASDSLITLCGIRTQLDF